MPTIILMINLMTFLIGFKFKIMKVVIYGATGWLGKSTINHLLNINKDVDLILIASKRKNYCFKIKKFDVLNPDDMKKYKK